VPAPTEQLFALLAGLPHTVIEHAPATTAAEAAAARGTPREIGGKSVLMKVEKVGWCVVVVGSATAGIIVAVNFVVMVSYEKGVKARGASGNFLIAYLVGSLFAFGGAAVYAGDTTVLQRAFLMGSLAALATAGREIAKDIADLAGDVDRATLPRRIGVPRAGAVAAACFVAGAAFSVVPPILGLFGLPYLGVVVVADGIFIYSGAVSAKNPARAQRAAKYGMVVALIAFLAGGFLG
jgi:geranylgeranylglycerol-phosphate geranylgeranyltransferase